MSAVKPSSMLPPGGLERLVAQQIVESASELSLEHGW
jgi:hypothetical protein